MKLGNHTAIISAAGAIALLVAAASPAHAATIVRESANDCGRSVLEYTAERQSDGTYRISYEGSLYWRSQDLGCGPTGDPYAPVLQWKGTQWGSSFGWEVAPDGYFDDGYVGRDGVPGPIRGSGFKDVRFRVCNWNTNTGYVGTCGSS